LFAFKDSRGGKKDISQEASNSRKPRGTIKVDCPANIQVRTITTFPEYGIDISSTPTKFGVRCQKKNMLKKFKRNSARKSEQMLSRHYVKIPLLHVHKGHLVGSQAGAKHLLDKCIVTKIHDLVERNIDNVTHVQGMLAEYVELDLFRDAPSEQKPHRDNQRFYPKKKDVENHIFRAKQAQKYCKNDQESLQRKVDDWKCRSPQTMFYYRASTVAGNSERDIDLTTAQSRKHNCPLLFVHQEPLQMRLLSRYGGELVFMDGVHNTTKYSLPLYFIYVKTNVGLKVVAEFVIQNDCQELISEAIRVVKSWNPAWNPSFWVTGFSKVEISAIEEQFPEATVYISDFHLLKEWQRWMQTSKNNLEIREQDDLLAFLNSARNSKTEDLLSSTVVEFQESALYKDKANVQKFVGGWLSCALRWAQAVRHPTADTIINMNDGIKEQTREFSYWYLPWTLDRSVYGIAVMLVESFIPDSYRSYVEMNTNLCQHVQEANPLAPPYLHHRPPSFVKHCLKAQFRAEREYKDPAHVVCVDFHQGEFKVRSSSTYNDFHRVQFEVPCCSCELWQLTRFPCEHFHAIFMFVEHWSFACLPAHYRNSPFISIDTEVDSSFLDHFAIYQQIASALIDHDYVTPGQAATDKGPSSNHANILYSLREQIQDRIVSMAKSLHHINDVDILQSVLTTMEELCSCCEKASTSQNADLCPPVKKLRLATCDDNSTELNKSTHTGESPTKSSSNLQTGANRDNQCPAMAPAATAHLQTVTEHVTQHLGPRNDSTTKVPKLIC